MCLSNTIQSQQRFQGILTNCVTNFCKINLERVSTIAIVLVNVVQVNKKSENREPCEIHGLLRNCK